MFLVVRWLAIAALVAFGVRRKSLTLWILIAMVAGAEIGDVVPQDGAVDEIGAVHGATLLGARRRGGRAC